MLNYRNNKPLQKKLHEWLVTRDYKLFATLIFNSNTISLNGFRSKLKELHKRIDKDILGRNFYKATKKSKRTQFFACVEHINSNLHSHLLITPPTKNFTEFKFISKYHWWKLCPAGEFNLVEINTENDLIETCGYTTKDCWNDENYNNFILSDEF